jgi:hypothetical protein
METAWIEVFILSFVECVAPAGKSVCQEQHFEIQMLGRDDCEVALQQLIAAKDELDYVIVDRTKSSCVPAAANVDAYANLESIEAANKDRPGWRSPAEKTVHRVTGNAEHRDRLVELPTCNDSVGVAPCTIGEVIVEAASGDAVEVWRRKD